MDNFFDKNFERINKLKHLMTFSKDSHEREIYKNKIEDIFKEFSLESKEEEEFFKFSKEKESVIKIIKREELALFNGKEKDDKYISVDELVYNVSNLEKFNEMPYLGLKLGADVTEEYKKIIKEGGEDILKGAPIVALLAEPYEEEIMEDKEEYKEEEELKIISKEELLSCDGKEGRLAYIAILGVVYDITDLPLVDILKNSGLSLGEDITFDFENLYRGDEYILKGAKRVGILHEFKESVRGKHIED